LRAKNIRPYWPTEIGSRYARSDGKFSVRKIGVQNLSYCILSVLAVQRRDTAEERRIKHVVYLKWPDHSVPSCTHDFLQIVANLNKVARQPKACSHVASDHPPIVMHCFAGIGRSGTAAAAYFLIELVQRKYAPDISRLVADLRRQRCLAVQGVIQYIFLYRAVAEFLLAKATLSAEFPQHLKLLHLLRDCTTKSECDLAVSVLSSYLTSLETRPAPPPKRCLHGCWCNFPT
uniref:TYR_PHOSPHATASE_2 domain-containing protein n=1 Tax=Soboliphyme baturini TaxID=241478 RepID=A0A183IJV8_9BILA